MTEKIVFWLLCQIFVISSRKSTVLGKFMILRKKNDNFESKLGHFEQRLTERLKKGLLTFETKYTVWTRIYGFE